MHTHIALAEANHTTPCFAPANYTSALLTAALYTRLSSSALAKHTIAYTIVKPI
jgi:hypothetical protein